MLQDIGVFWLYFMQIKPSEESISTSYNNRFKNATEQETWPYTHWK